MISGRNLDRLEEVVATAADGSIIPVVADVTDLDDLYKKAYADLFEILKLEDLQRFERFFSSTIHFKDPFNDARGIEEVKQVFSHMFEHCAEYGQSLSQGMRLLTVFF